MTLSYGLAAEPSYATLAYIQGRRSKCLCQNLTSKPPRGQWCWYPSYRNGCILNSVRRWDLDNSRSCPSLCRYTKRSCSPPIQLGEICVRVVDSKLSYRNPSAKLRRAGSSRECAGHKDCCQ